MTPGFYAPCHRPMCIGPPQRFGAELEASMNRLYFPLSEQAHVLVFSTPDGENLACPVPPGRYTAPQLCRVLEERMTAVAGANGAGGVAFVVSQDAAGRFVFECERRPASGGAPRPAPFGLLFNHPRCIDPARLGFPPEPLVGETSYTATSPTRLPAVGGRGLANIVRVAEATHQKRFRLHCVAPPPMTAVVRGGAKGGAVDVATHVGCRAFAHGLQPGDVVRLAPHAAVEVADPAGGARTVRETAAVLPVACSAVVLEVLDAFTVRLRPPSLDGVADADTCVQLLAPVQPWNVHFGRPGSLPAHLVGFPPRAVQHGVDGSIEGDGGLRLPPFEAPFVHCLDHPDYVIITFSEGSGAGLQHCAAGENRLIFCKLSLYTLFREERMLPRDTTLMRDNLQRFTIGFWNPDFTPYHFHGAHFSFSLNFVTPTP